MQITQEKTDRDQLRMLSIFHFVFAGFSCVGLGFLLLHHLIMRAVFAQPNWAGNTGAAPPPEVFAIIGALYWVIGGAILVQTVLAVLSGYFLWHRQYRTFSIIVACINCLSLPLGTVLGVFTLVVLMRESVQTAYGDY